MVQKKLSRISSVSKFKITDKCIEGEKLAAFIDDNCTDKEREDIILHLQKCRYCSHIVAATIKITDLIKMQDKSVNANIRICQKCNCINTHEMKYCQECGTALSEISAPKCSGCGAEIRPISRFCPACGVKLPGSKKPNE